MRLNGNCRPASFLLESVDRRQVVHNRRVPRSRIIQDVQKVNGQFQKEGWICLVGVFPKATLHFKLYLVIIFCGIDPTTKIFSLLENVSIVAVQDWNKKCNSRLQIPDSSALLTAEFISFKFLINPSPTDHPMESDSLFDMKGFFQVQVVDHYYGYLVYSRL